MELKRDGIPVDQQTYLQTTPAMRKMQDMANKLTNNTPELGKYLSNESSLKPGKAFPISSATVKKGGNTGDDKKLPGSTILPPIKDQSSA